MNLATRLYIELRLQVFFSVFAKEEQRRKFFDIIVSNFKGNSEFVEWLINSQTDADYPEKASQVINAVDDDGKSPLHIASGNGGHFINWYPLK